MPDDALFWALHLAYAMLVAGYAALALAWAGLLLHPVAALHLLAIGAVGGMTLAMMTRAPEAVDRYDVGKSSFP